MNAILKAYSGRCYQSFTPCTERCSLFPLTSLQQRAFMLKHEAKGPQQKLTEWTVPFSPSARWPAARVCATGWCCALTTEGFMPAAATPPPNPTSRRSVWWQCPVINPLVGLLLSCFKPMSNSTIKHPSPFPLWGISLRYPPSWGQACVAQAGHWAGGGDCC